MLDESQKPAATRESSRPFRYVASKCVFSSPYRDNTAPEGRLVTAEKNIEKARARKLMSPVASSSRSVLRQLAEGSKRSHFGYLFMGPCFSINTSDT